MRSNDPRARHLILQYEVLKYDGDIGSPNVFCHVTESAVKRKLENLMTVFRRNGEKVVHRVSLPVNAPDPGNGIEFSESVCQGVLRTQNRRLTGLAATTLVTMFATADTGSRAGERRLVRLHLHGADSDARGRRPPQEVVACLAQRRFSTTSRSSFSTTTRPKTSALQSAIAATIR
jgi:hypothetical protein